MRLPVEKVKAKKVFCYIYNNTPLLRSFSSNTGKIIFYLAVVILHYAIIEVFLCPYVKHLDEVFDIFRIFSRWNPKLFFQKNKIEAILYRREVRKALI